MKAKPMTTVTQMKCACESCLCVVNLSDAVHKDEKYYCCEACARGEECTCPQHNHQYGTAPAGAAKQPGTENE